MRSTRPVLAAVTVAATLLTACQPTHTLSTGTAGPQAGPGAAYDTGGVDLTPVGPGQCHMRGALPDPACTPGATNPAVTPATVHSTICQHGWTATIRPPVAYTNRLKIQQIHAYGFADTNPADYEEDHLVALEDGGHPTDPRNLWPQPRNSHADPAINNEYAASKDGVETAVSRGICSGRITLAAGQQAIARDWTTALATLGLHGA
jgi:hypothetical protein